MRRAILVVALLALAGCGAESSQKQALSASRSSSPSSHGDAFSIVRIDDAVDPLGNITEDQLPRGSGMGLYQERSMVSGAHLVQIHFVRTVSKDGESPDQTCARFLGWARGALSMPPGDRFACEPVVEYDATTKESTPAGVRSYVLTGEPVVTAKDVVDAYLGDDRSDPDVDSIVVAVKISPDARARLKNATEQWIHRRMAILAQGRIDSAPLVKGAIDTDTLSILFGRRTSRETDRAQAYVNELRGK